MKEGVKQVTLGELTTTINGLWTGKKPPFINVGVIRNTNFTKDCQLNLSDVAFLDVEVKQFSSRKLQSGDIIIEKSGGSDKQPVGRPVLFELDEGDYSFSNFTSTLRILDRNVIIPKYLHKALVGLYQKGETKRLQSKTTGLHNLDFKAYLRIKIPVPPLSEQRSIVSELDLLRGIIDKKKEQQRELDRLAQASFYDMFGDPITNEKGWERSTFGENFTIGSGGTPSKTVPQYWENGNIPWIGSNLCQNAIIYETDGKFITEDGLQHSSAKLLSEDYLLIALVGATIGKVGLLKCKTAINQNIAYVNVKENGRFSPIYLFYYTRGLYPLFVGIGDGRFKMANQQFVRQLPLSIPDITLQKDFSKHIEIIEHQKSLISQSIQETQTLLDATMDKYFG